MPKGDKPSHTDKQKRQGATRKDHEPQGVGRSEAQARAWASANKLHGGGKKFVARHKIPSGPVGGSGRKTNLSRSS